MPNKSNGKVGTWLSPDKMRQFASPYLYAGNGFNPIGMIDPDGKTGFPIRNAQYMMGDAPTNPAASSPTLSELRGATGVLAMGTGIAGIFFPPLLPYAGYLGYTSAAFTIADDANKFANDDLTVTQGIMDAASIIIPIKTLGPLKNAVSPNVKSIVSAEVNGAFAVSGSIVDNAAIGTGNVTINEADIVIENTP